MSNRRAFITLVGGAAAWPFAARAQQPAMPVIGFLSTGAPEPFAHLVTAFRQGLKETGFVEGQNVAIVYRWAEDHYDRLTALAAELARHQIAVIVASGGNISALAAKAAVPTVPIVFSSSSDPVKNGLVVSLNRPGGNITGVAGLTIELDAKRLGLLRELSPTAGVIGVLMNPNRPDAEAQLQYVQEAARSLGQQITVLRVSTEGELGLAFTTFVQQRIDALLISAGPFFLSRREEIVALAARHALPAIYQDREFLAVGGLMSYGPSIAETYRQVGIYTGRILKGEKPADLPVWQPTKFELVINLKTAKALGLTVPPSLLALADEVIE